MSQRESMLNIEGLGLGGAQLSTDPTSRAFKLDCDAALLQFEKAQEWADLIRYLQRLQRTLNKYSQLPWIPDKVLVAKRLYQCLNPALPSGVHLKTLETVELIFSRIGPQRLARDLAFYSEGIFPLYRHASYSVRPVLLDLFERHYVPLGPKAVPCLPGLVLALLSAMEDVASDLFHRAVRLIDVAERTSVHETMGAIWGRLLHNATVRNPALSTCSCAFRSRRSPAAMPRSRAAWRRRRRWRRHRRRRAFFGSSAPMAGGRQVGRSSARGSSARMPVSRQDFCPDARGPSFARWSLLCSRATRWFVDSRSRCC